MGRSPGFAPFRILSTYTAARPQRSATFTPYDISPPASANSLSGSNYGFADVSLASYYKIGYAQLDFANAVMQAPHPRSLGPEQRIQYDSMLRDQMRPYREGAEKAFRITLEQAKTAAVENEWTARARGALVEFGGERAPAPAAGSREAVPVLVPPSAS